MTAKKRKNFWPFIQAQDTPGLFNIQINLAIITMGISLFAKRQNGH